MEDDFPWVVPRQYANVCTAHGPEYTQYESSSPAWGKQEDYEIIKKIGRGKYSEVFDGYSLAESQKVVIKILKPVKKIKIKREIKILKTLAGKNNTIKLIDVVRDTATKTPALILERVQNTNFKVQFVELADIDLRFYMYEVLRALDYSHSMGVMHRDVKPGNIMIDHEQRLLRLVDWGLADFYFPKKEYNVRVASRYYKAPELLLDYRFYDYSLDVWSFGAVLAGWVFKKEPFFHGADNFDQLIKIVKILGTDDLADYVERFALNTNGIEEALQNDFPKRSWDRFITKENQQYASPEALDLIDKCLQMDHSLRILPCEALQHLYFDPVKELLSGSTSYAEGTPQCETAKRLRKRGYVDSNAVA